MYNENAWALTRPPATCLCQYSCPKSRQRMLRCRAVTSWRDVTLLPKDIKWRDIMKLLHMTSYWMTKRTCTDQPIWKSENHVFQPSDLDLWPWPSNLSEILSRSIPPLNLESVRSTVQPGERWQTDRQTDTHTDGTDSIPSTAYAGGNNFDLKSVRS